MKIPIRKQAASLNQLISYPQGGKLLLFDFSVETRMIRLCEIMRANDAGLLVCDRSDNSFHTVAASDAPNLCRVITSESLAHNLLQSLSRQAQQVRDELSGVETSDEQVAEEAVSNSGQPVGTSLTYNRAVYFRVNRVTQKVSMFTDNRNRVWGRIVGYVRTRKAGRVTYKVSCVTVAGNEHVWKVPASRLIAVRDLALAPTWVKQVLSKIPTLLFA